MTDDRDIAEFYRASKTTQKASPRNVVKMDIDYYLADDKPNPPSARLRQKNEETRQRTSENRFHELHLTTYPVSINGENIPHPLSVPPPPRTAAAAVVTAPELLLRNSPRRDHDALHPTMRTTNQVFCEAMRSAYEKLHFSPSRPFVPGHHEVVGTNPQWSESDRADILMSKTLPYDSTVKAAVGPLKTAYRDEFCRNARAEEFQGQLVFTKTTHFVASPRRECSAEHVKSNNVTPRQGVKNSRTQTDDSTTATGRAVAAHPNAVGPQAVAQSSRNSTPRSTRPDQQEFAPFTQSYFTNKAKYTAI